MHFLGSIMVSLLVTAITVSASAGEQLIERKAAPVAKTAEPFYTTSAHSYRQSPQPQYHPAPIRSGLVPHCNTGTRKDIFIMCASYCTCTAQQTMHCSLKIGMA